MLGFIAILGVSVGVLLLAQALDIECANQPKRSAAARRRAAAEKDAHYPNGAAIGGLR